MSYDLNTVNETTSRDASLRGPLDRLYDRLLRDVFGRIVPGLLLLLSVAVSVTSFIDVNMALERATFWMWLLALGAGWLTSFALLEIGSRFNLALFSPEATTFEQYWAAEERFRAGASRRQRAEYDRLVTIRDALAAASVSLFVSLATLAVDFVMDVHLHESPWSEIRNGATAVLVMVALGIALQVRHREYVRRAWNHLSHAAREHGRTPAPSASRLS